MPNHFPPPYAYQDQIVEEEGELLLYRFHGWLSSLSADVKLRHLGRPRDLERALLYIEARDPTRARLLHGALQMMGALLDEASDLVNDGIHWPTVEAFLLPIGRGIYRHAGTMARAGSGAKRRRQCARCHRDARTGRRTNRRGCHALSTGTA